MGLAHWLRPPRRTLAVFFGLMLVLGGALGWLGWQWLKQDRALEGQRLQESLELAADQMAAALQQSLTDLESVMSFVPSPGAKEPPDGVLVLRVTKSNVGAYPSGVLLYYPVIPDAVEPTAATFAAGENRQVVGRNGDTKRGGRRESALASRLPPNKGTVLF